MHYVPRGQPARRAVAQPLEGRETCPEASTRAALVLATVGCPLDSKRNLYGLTVRSVRSARAGIRSDWRRSC